MVEWTIGIHRHCDVEDSIFKKETYGVVESFKCYICEVKKYICCDCLKLSPEQFAKRKRNEERTFCHLFIHTKQ